MIDWNNFLPFLAGWFIALGPLWVIGFSILVVLMRREEHE